MAEAPTSPGWNAKLYDDKHSFVWKHGESLLALLDVKPGERIVDLGCGTGHLTAQIAAAGAEVVGLDSSAEMVDEARRLYPQIRFEVADARTFQLDQPCDAVFSNAVLHWVKQPEQVAARLAVALKPDGRFVAELGGHGNTRAIMAALRRQIEAFAIEGYEFPWYYPGIAEYSSVLAQHGLEVTFATLFDRPTPLEGDDGLRKWLEMFASSLISRVNHEDRAAFLAAVEQELRPALYRDNTWVADYRRLRVIAVKRQTR